MCQDAMTIGDINGEEGKKTHFFDPKPFNTVDVLDRWYFMIDIQKTNV